MQHEHGRNQQHRRDNQAENAEKLDPFNHQLLFPLGDPRLPALTEAFCTGSIPRFGGPQLFYLWGHSYEFDAGRSWDVIGRFLDRVAPLGKQLWFATNGELVRYTEAYRALLWSADGGAVTNPTSTDLWIGVGRDGVREIPAGASVQLL